MQSNFLNLKPGDRAKVTFFGQGDPNCRRKLLTMGLISLVLFRVIRVVPLKDSLAILVNGFYLTLHSKEADILNIEMVKQ
jgi:Fe2+ transport system protein FeoA